MADFVVLQRGARQRLPFAAAQLPDA